MGWMELQTVDYTGEVSIVRFPCEDLTAANIAAVVAAGTALEQAFEDITGCIVVSKKFVASVSPLSAEHRSANTEAEREQRWLHRYYDATTFERYTLTTPGSLMAHKDPSNRGFALLTQAAIAAYKTAFQAFVKPGANAVTLESMEWVGRNN